MTFKLRETYHYYYLLFFSLVIIVSAVGLYYYNYVQEKEKNEVYSNLSTIAKLKIKEIVKWREDRISEAQFIQRNTQFKQLIHGFIQYPQLNTLKKDIVEWLMPIKENHEYINISIIADTEKVYSLFKDNDSLNNHDKFLIRRCIESKEIILAGFYKYPVENEIALGCFIPLFLKNKPDENFGVLVLKIDPRKNLYPLIEINPTTYKSAESFIVAQYQDSVIFLNDLKFRKNAALSFKLPLSADNLPAAMAVKGKEGIYQGRDYAGIEVLADLNKIPNSEWFIVSKVNLDEVYAPVKEQALYILFGVLTLILLSGAIVFIAWKNEKIRSFSRQLHLEQQKKDLFKNMSEGYAYCKMLFEDDIPIDFIYLEVNDAFSEITGLKNVTGKRVTEIIPGIKEINPELFEIYGRVALTGVPEKFETFVETLGIWFSISAYSPERGYFIAIFNDITGQKNYLIELKKLSRAVEQSPASVVITDLNGLIEYVNPKFTEVTGYTLEEVIGKNPRILKSGKTPKYIFTKLWKTITAGKEWRGELYNKKKNGELYWEFASISPIKNENGINTHYIAVKEDITKRKQIEKELEASEERFSKAFRSNPNALVISRIADDTILEVNETYLKLFGYSRIEIVGNSSIALNMYVNPDDREKAIQLMKKNGSLKDFELKIKAKNGAERIVLLSSEFLQISGEQSILTILQDITERREAEEKLKISEQHYREVVETQQELLVKVDMEGRFTFVNEAYCKKFGVKKEDLIGKSTFKPLVYPDDLPDTLEKMKELESPPYRATIEQRAYTSEGLRWIEWSDTAIVDNNGKIIEIQGVGRDIHDRKEAERALQESEELLKRAQEISHLGSWQLDLINDKLTWSDEVYKIFGLKPQEFKATYEAFLEAVHPEDREAVNEAYSGSIRDGKDTYEIEHRVIRRTTGEIRFVHEKCEHFKDSSGKIFLSIGMVHDITEQKQTENELNESLSLHQTISSTVPFGMQIVDKTGMILFANESIIKLAAENIKGHKCWEIYKDDKKQCIDCPLPKPSQVGTTTMIEVEGVLGGRIFEIYHTEMIYKGKPAFLEIFQDITSRKKAEEALQLSEQSFRHLADSMPQLVWTADPDGIVDYYNNRVVEFDGISKKEDGSWAWSPVLHEDDTQPTIEAWSNSVKTGSNYEIIHRIKKKDGKLKWFLSRAYPIKDPKGKIIKWYGTSTDINEQKKTEEQLELALLELKRSNKELDQFAYTASHDLQEPIRMVKSYAQILSMNSKNILNNSDIDHLDYIIEGASRMQALINDLLKYSRVNTTKKKFELVDCNIILKDVLDDLKLRIKEENALIEIGELPVIKGDETQLRQVFQNLIQNAVKFRGKNNPEIKIGSEKKNGQWIFSIKDNGIGIDPKFHDKIFVIFHRLHNRDKYPGTGIGLSICKKIVELHGGQMYVDSELNKGTTFYFTIPA